MHLTYEVGFGVRVPCVGTLRRHASAVGAGQARCRCPPTIPGMWPSASGHRGRSTAVDSNKKTGSDNRLVGQGVLLLPTLDTPSLLPHCSPSRAQRQMMPAHCPVEPPPCLAHMLAPRRKKKVSSGTYTYTEVTIGSPTKARASKKRRQQWPSMTRRSGLARAIHLVPSIPATGVEHTRWMGPEGPTRDVHEQAKCDAGWAARI